MARFLLLLLHNLLLPVALLFMAPAAMRKMKARGGKVSDLWQRFGFFRQETRQRLALLQQRSSVLWLHAASVGEVGIAAKLIRELQKQDSALGFVLTTTTPTGYAAASRAAVDLGEHFMPLYSALDGWFVVRRFLNAIKPTQLILVESEIWPNLLFASRRRGIPVSLVNARLSPRSERRYQKVGPFARAIFSMFSRVYVQEPEDVGRWSALGVAAANINQPGSIKFDMVGQAEPFQQVGQFRGFLSGLGWAPTDPVLLAASTHPGEELALAKVFLQLKADFPALRLLVVPRHVERGPVLLQELLNTGMSTVRRSALLHESPEEFKFTPDCLLVDTTGELRAWQYLATAVIVGKSFLSTGGQNPAEAVMAGRPVLFGPHMENFDALVRHLLRHDGAIQVEDFATLEKKLGEILQSSDTARKTALAGRNALIPHEGATRRTAESLLSAKELQKTM